MFGRYYGGNIVIWMLVYNPAMVNGIIERSGDWKQESETYFKLC